MWNSEMVGATGMQCPSPRFILRTLPALLALAAFLHAPADAAAQNWLLAPSYGEVELFAGFPEDPYTVRLVAGGTSDISRLGYRGRVAEEPDFDLWYEAGSFPITFRVEGAPGATLLLINDPTGRWHYSAGSGADARGEPRIVFRNPPSGLYNVWVGTLRNEFVPVTLVITEF
ncbi:MAG: peptidase S1 [Spirochaetaceae bacterium]|nr:MAG: peptidase S1 [Spirochaetaceae bacterium]